MTFRHLAATLAAMGFFACAAAAPGARAQVADTAVTQGGDAAQAKAMLERATAAILKDEQAALAAFSAGAPGFRSGDLYVFCARRDGTVDAHVDPAQIGRKLQDQYDKVGVAFGQEMMAVAVEGKMTEVAYMWPKPNTLTPVHKVTFVTRVADQVCGVGFYL